VFRDSPEPEQWKKVVDLWQSTDGLSKSKGRSFEELSEGYRDRLESARDPAERVKLEKRIIDRLYAFIRRNIKRGCLYDLREVLQNGEADCLGYGKLFTTLGRACGLDTGVVEIVVDNRGRHVPHTGSLVRLSGGKRQLLDFWYGSTDIRHKRLGLQVKRQGQWEVQDIDFRDMAKMEDISYLPDDRVDAITLYVEGNRSLKEGLYRQAVKQYTEAAGLYPQNVRIYYNRAVGYENLGQKAKAEADYARALKDTAAIGRTLATQPQDVVDLIKLDDAFIPEIDQEIYLLQRGFITGRPVPAERIARKLRLPPEEVDAILSMVNEILDSLE
jgi:tetratricopeptide (TPR) repeat protein